MNKMLDEINNKAHKTEDLYKQTVEELSQVKLNEANLFSKLSITEN
jgi:hypothetical protein